MLAMKNTMLFAEIVSKALIEASSFENTGDISNPRISTGGPGLRPSAKLVCPRPIVNAMLSIKPSKTDFGMSKQYTCRPEAAVRMMHNAEINDSHGIISAPYKVAYLNKMATNAPAGPTTEK